MKVFKSINISLMIKRLRQNANYFSDKGTFAEKVLAKASAEKYLKDYTFANHKLKSEKGDVELCDLLMVNGKNAIIWQLKNIKQKNGRYKKSEIQRGIRQAQGAARKLTKLGIIKLTNLAGSEKEIDFNDIENIYRITALSGKTLKDSTFFQRDERRGDVHIMYGETVSYIFDEMDTISDLIKYLDGKEKLHETNNLHSFSDEREIAAYFLMNGKTFGEIQRLTGGTVVFSEGIKKAVKKDKQIQKKKKIDKKWSKAWDMLLEKAADVASNRGDPNTDYKTADKCVMKMESHDRFQRRVLGKLFVSAALRADEKHLDENVIFRRYFPTSEGITYVFSFHNPIDSLKIREQNLFLSAIAAASKFRENNLIVSISTNSDLLTNKEHEEFHWLMVDGEEMNIDEVLLNPVLRKGLIENKYLTEPEIFRITEAEYPEI